MSDPSTVPTPSHGDLKRLEDKVDKLTDVVTKMVLIEERQMRQGERFEAVEQRIEKQAERIDVVSANLSRWINRGAGAWGILATAWMVYQGLQGH